MIKKLIKKINRTFLDCFAPLAKTDGRLAPPIVRPSSRGVERSGTTKRFSSYFYEPPFRLCER
ncbi:MAG: hypothetical protein ABIG87_02885 [Patescibacteria group bacterium]